MELTRIQLDKEIKYDDCNLLEIIEGIKASLMSTIYEKKAVIETKLEVANVKYPLPYLESIMYNLLSNALKYSSAERQPIITVSSVVASGKVKITVKDNGIGIDLQKHGHDMFKLNKIFHEGYESQGVGLYLTKTQIENLGGTIEVVSEVHLGTAFIVTI